MCTQSLILCVIFVNINTNTEKYISSIISILQFHRFRRRVRTTKQMNLYQVLTEHLPSTTDTTSLFSRRCYVSENAPFIFSATTLTMSTAIVCTITILCTITNLPCVCWTDRSWTIGTTWASTTDSNMQDSDISAGEHCTGIHNALLAALICN